MAIQFKKATREKVKLRLALYGPSSSGKTFTALRLARGLGGRVAVIDTERRRASLYAGEFDFDTLDMDTFAPATFTAAIHAAEAQGYDVIVIDSLTHAWAGIGGVLERVDAGMTRYKGNKFAAWKDESPPHHAMVDAIIRCKAHVIATMRSKTEYTLTTDARGKSAPQRVGMAPIQRDGLEYDFTMVGEMTPEHQLVVIKPGMHELDGAVVDKPGEDLAKRLLAWLNEGEAAPAPAAPRLMPVPAAPPPADETSPEVVQLKSDLAASADLGREITALGRRLDELVGPDVARVMREAEGVVNVKAMTTAQRLVARDALRALVDGAEADAAIGRREPTPDADGETPWGGTTAGQEER